MVVGVQLGVILSQNSHISNTLSPKRRNALGKCVGALGALGGGVRGRLFVTAKTLRRQGRLNILTQTLSVNQALCQQRDRGDRGDRGALGTGSLSSRPESRIYPEVSGSALALAAMRDNDAPHGHNEQRPPERSDSTGHCRQTDFWIQGVQLIDTITRLKPFPILPGKPSTLTKKCVRDRLVVRQNP